MSYNSGWTHSRDMLCVHDGCTNLVNYIQFPYCEEHAMARGLGASHDDTWFGDVIEVPEKGKEKDPHGLDPQTPGAKLDSGKVMAGVLEDFSLALLEVAKVGTYGAKKYTRGGWQEVPEGIQRYTDAMWRHLLYERHEPIDPDFGLLHAAHLAWNALARLELMLRKEQGK